MDIPSGQDLFDARRGLDEQNEGLFWQWVDPKEDEGLFAVFDAAICHCTGALSQETRRFTGPLSRPDFPGH